MSPDSGCARSIRNIAAATTATVVDAVGAYLKTLRRQPALRFLPPYHDDAAYLGALGQRRSKPGSRRSISPPTCCSRAFHGMPERTLRARRSLSRPVPGDRRACWRRRSVAPSRSASSRASGAPNGSSPRPTRGSNSSDAKAAALRFSRPAFRPIVLKRSRSSRSAARSSSRRRAGGTSPTSLPQRRRARHGDAGGAGAPRTRRLAVIAAAYQLFRSMR